MRVTPIPSAYQKMVNVNSRVEESHNDKERRHSGKDSGRDDKKERADKEEFTHEADAQKLPQQRTGAFGYGDPRLKNRSVRITRVLVSAKGKSEEQAQAIADAGSAAGVE
jgi:hypothetical protein